MFALTNQSDLHTCCFQGKYTVRVRFNLAQFLEEKRPPSQINFAHWNRNIFHTLRFPRGPPPAPQKYVTWNTDAMKMKFVLIPVCQLKNSLSTCISRKFFLELEANVNSPVAITPITQLTENEDTKHNTYVRLCFANAWDQNQYCTLVT